MENKEILRFIDLTKKTSSPRKFYDRKDLEILLSSLEKGTEVSHISFGDGKVVSISDSTISVIFDDGEKMFLYPQCFYEGFLEVLS